MKTEVLIAIIVVLILIVVFFGTGCNNDYDRRFVYFVLVAACVSPLLTQLGVDSPI